MLAFISNRVRDTPVAPIQHSLYFSWGTDTVISPDASGDTMPKKTWSQSER
jgi:hypothetical protein